MHTHATLEATVAFSVVRQSHNMWSNWVILKTSSNALFEVITSYNDTVYNHYITFFYMHLPISYCIEIALP